MHLQYQRPGIGDDQHDHTWALTAADGLVVSHHHSPEAGLCQAIIIEQGRPLRLRRTGPDRFDLTRP